MLHVALHNKGHLLWSFLDANIAFRCAKTALHALHFIMFLYRVQRLNPSWIKPLCFSIYAFKAPPLKPNVHLLLWSWSRPCASRVQTWPNYVTV